MFTGLINWRGLHLSHIWTIHLHLVQMLRLVLCLLHFFRFHFAFLFAKSYVGWEVSGLASHLHVFCFKLEGKKMFEDWGKGIQKIRIGGVGGGGVLLLGGLVPHYVPQSFPEYLYGHRFIVINGQKPLKSVFKRSIISCSPHI